MHEDRYTHKKIIFIPEVYWKDYRIKFQNVVPKLLKVVDISFIFALLEKKHFITIISL